MKISCSRGKLNEAIQAVSPIVQQKMTIPVLSNVKLTATKKGKEGELEVIGTDLDIGVRWNVPLKQVDEEGVLVLPAARLGAILRENPDEEIRLESDGHLAQIVCASGHYKIIGVDPSEYPAIPDFQGAASIVIDAKDFSEMIRKTQFAASSEMVRYALTGQLLEVVKSKSSGAELRMVASDGKRLAFIKKKYGGKDAPAAGKGSRVLVPPRALNIVDKMVSGEDETVSILVDENQVKMSVKQGMVFARLIEGNFPDYEAVIPKEPELKVTLDTQKFYSAVKQAALMTSDKARAIKLSFTKDKLTLLARTQDVGEARVEMDVVYKGEAVEIVFNPDFLTDYTKVVNEATIDLFLKDKSSAGIFKSGKDYVYVAMPLAIAI